MQGRPLSAVPVLSRRDWGEWEGELSRHRQTRLTSRVAQRGRAAVPDRSGGTGAQERVCVHKTTGRKAFAFQRARQ